MKEKPAAFLIFTWQQIFQMYAVKKLIWRTIFQIQTMAQVLSNNFNFSNRNIDDKKIRNNLDGLRIPNFPNSNPKRRLFVLGCY